MKKLFVRLLKRLTKSLEEEQEIIHLSEEISKEIPTLIEEHTIPIEIEKTEKKQTKTSKKKPSKDLVTIPSFDPRDMMEIMQYPFLSLSKNRTSPINYESPDGTIKVKVSCHTEHYIASIYDWDIVMFVESKMQEIMNSGSDIPPRTLIVPRHEILKSLRKHNGKKEEKDLKASLARLKTTLIETNIRNEDGRYDAGFGFLDSWGYTDRKDIKEIRITLSQWLYDGICKKGSLLKITSEYFDITSGLKKFLYRTARKHVGIQNDSWSLPLEILYEKSASEQEFKKFKYDLKKAVLDNDIPGYFLEWIEQDGKTYVCFVNKIKELKKILSQ
jgi:plasmid replication initiation protein